MHLIGVVARGGAVRGANYDAEGARRVRIDLSRFESMERYLRQLALRTSFGAERLG
jgi:hypothetical protein